MVPMFVLDNPHTASLQRCQRIFMDRNQTEVPLCSETNQAELDTRWTYTDASLLLHATRRVVEVGEQHGHLVVDRQQLVLPFLQLVLQSNAVNTRDVGRHRLPTQTGAARIKSVHRLAEVLVAELNLDRALRLQDATPAQRFHMVTALLM